MSTPIVLQEYREEYQESSFWRKLRRQAVAAGSVVIEKALVLFYCLQDPQTPPWARSVIMGALGYFILPLDAIPDVMPVLGFSDDLGALVSALAVVAMHVKPVHRLQARQRLDAWFNS